MSILNDDFDIVFDKLEAAHRAAMEDMKSNVDHTQEGGDHYKRMSVQPWDVYDTWPKEQRIGAYRANCVKYAMRLDAKDTRLLNAKKLRHYAQKLADVLEEYGENEQ